MKRNDDQAGDGDEQAVEALRAIGLTEYQARTFVGLYRRRRGTAREVAEASGVPRSRIYETLNELHEEGLVDVQQSTPREYLAVPVATLVDTLAESYRERESALRNAFSVIDQRDAAETDSRPEGVWVVADRDRVLSLERGFVRSADEQIVFGLATAEVFADETADTLEAASERVDVVVECADEGARERFDAVAGIDVMTPDRAWEDTPELEGRVGRILVVDGRHVLVSTVLENGRGEPDEAAVWTSGGGPGDGLVLALREFMLERVADRL